MSHASLTEAVESLGREQVDDIVTLQYITDRSLLLERLTPLMSSFFGSLVLLLAGVGLFGLMSYAVAQRRREVGIRMALGADRDRVVRNVVGEGLAVTLAGLAGGAVIALVAVRVVRPLLFGVTPQDPLTFLFQVGAVDSFAILAVALLAAVGVLACTLPALRAMRLQAVEALQQA